MKKMISTLLVICIFVSVTCCVSAVNAVETDTKRLIGDVNGDGFINIRDATCIQRLVAELEYETEENRIYGDVNVSGDLTIVDSTEIQKYIALFSCSEYIGTVYNSGESQEKYTVTFYGYDGSTVLKTEKITGGATVIPPTAPTKDGTNFLGWSGNYYNVTQNESIKAVYSDEQNVFVVSPGNVSANNTVDVMVSIDGTVKTCGFDINVMYDSDLELVAYDDDLDLDVVVNTKAYENGIKLNFSSISDKKKQRNIIGLTFKIKDLSKKYLRVMVTMNSIKEIYNNNPVNANYTIINGLINNC